MATNVFFSQAVKTEQNLIEDLVVESLRMYGHNCYYLPRKIVNEDTILGDAADSKFEDAYEVEMYLEGVEGFEGEGDLYSKFGVEVRDTATFILSRRSWERFVSLDANLATGLRPNEGDLVYFPLSKRVFEIKFVEHENPFYQLGKLYVFKLTCDLFEYSGEDFDTNIEALDVDLELAQGTAVELTLADTPSLRDFVVGESVSQQISSSVVVSGTVSAWDESSNKLTISRISSTDTTDTFQTFQVTDTTIGNITAEDSLDNDKIILSGTGQEGHYIDFEAHTAPITLPSFVTDGTTGTDNLTLETHTQGSGISLESGTSIDSTGFDHIVLEDSLASRRTINTVGSDQQLSTDAGAFNLDIETDADGIIDFSEGNPFGDAT